MVLSLKAVKVDGPELVLELLHGLIGGDAAALNDS